MASPLVAALMADPNNVGMSEADHSGFGSMWGKLKGGMLGQLVAEPFRKGAGMMQTMRDYSANEFPATMGAIAQSTDYDPRREAAGYAAGTAMNMVGMPGGQGGFGAGARLPKAKAQPSAEPMFPQYAEVYPPVGPPTPTLDPVKGVMYDAKTLTLEAEAFKKERARIMKDMEKSGYKPYFDPAKRTYADPTHYPPNTNTLDIVPKKQVTIDKDMALIGSDEARKRLDEAFAAGSKSPNAKDWYATGQLEDAFVKELGPVEGRRAYGDNFATGMAATTGGADPTANLLMSQYGNYLRQNNLPYPVTHQMPFPIGGRYAANNMAKHREVFDAGGFPGLGETNPKRHNFAQNFMGNRGVATMDEQMTSGMTPGLQMPPPGKYGLYEKVLHDAAAKAGVPPANFQDVAWAGFKGSEGNPMINHVNDAIERTHRLTGMPRDEIVRRGFVRSEIPIYGMGGLAGLGLSSLPTPSEGQ
jgi:hypothetical protein